MQVKSLKDMISHALTEMENGQVSPMNIDAGKPTSKQEALVSLMEYITGEQFVQAVQLLHAYR